MSNRINEAAATKEEEWNKENSGIQFNGVKKVKIGQNYAQLLKYAKS